MVLMVPTLLQAAVERRSLDLKLPTQAMIEHQTVSGPILGSTYVLKNADAGNTSTAAASITSFSAQPDVPRNIVITPGGTTADVAACTVVVAGTDFFGQSISEDFAFLANASTATTGSKAFKTVSSVTFPANCEDTPFGASWSVGTGSKLGLKRCMDDAGHFLHASLAGVKEATAPTVAVGSTTAVSGNTATLNSALNGSDVDLFFMQNYSCTP